MFGVLLPIKPRVYQLRLLIPMLSPQITRMFGFLGIPLAFSGWVCFLLKSEGLGGKGSALSRVIELLKVIASSASNDVCFLLTLAIASERERETWRLSPIPVTYLSGLSRLATRQTATPSRTKGISRNGQNLVVIMRMAKIFQEHI